VDVNQLIPIKYQWAWQYYLDGCANHWMPQEISMQRDIEQWKNPKGFTDDERTVIKCALGFFSTAETIVANNPHALSLLNRDGDVFQSPNKLPRSFSTYHQIMKEFFKSPLTLLEVFFT